MINARDYALLELDRRDLPHWPAGAVRARQRGTRQRGTRRGRGGAAAVEAPADPRDRALAEQITVGVIKNLLLLQYLVEHYAGRSSRSIDPLVQKILAIALYQLRFLQRIPASAALNEAVEQARRFGQSRAAGFVNAILRNATRQPDAPLPDDLPAYAAIVLSHPVPLYERFVELVGPADALRLCEHDNREPPTIVRRLPAGGAGSAGVQALTDSEAPDLRVIEHAQPGMLVVENARRSTFARWARLGLAQVQDPTAAAVAAQCDLAAGMVVLDRCAGLGTKTMQLCEAVGADGQVVAIDPHPRRIAGLKRLAAQRGLAELRTHQASMLAETSDAGQTFDRALVDVPCSNSGVLARRPEARYAQSPQALASLARLQDAILDDTAPAVKSGGLLIYSTCSLWPEENRQRVDAFLARHADYALLRDHLTLPSLDADPTVYRDGGYWAVMARAR